MAENRYPINRSATGTNLELRPLSKVFYGVFGLTFLGIWTGLYLLIENSNRRCRTQDTQTGRDHATHQAHCQAATNSSKETSGMNRSISSWPKRCYPRHR